MRLTRRGFIAAAAATCAAPRAGASPEGVLRAMQGAVQLAPADMPKTAIWGYGGVVPGPTLRVPLGGRVTRRLQNALAEPTTIHWHGLRLPNAMDGVPGLTQAAVPPGGAFLYDFPVQDAGTFWYHSHERTWEQMARGLYGALVVEETAPPQVDRDEVLILDDWRLTADAAIEGGFGALHDMAHGGRMGNWLTVNGQGEWRTSAPAMSRLRLRLINAANARIMTLGVKGLAGWVVALDGMPLDAPLPLDQVVLAPAQRADLIVDVTAAEGEEALIIAVERGEGLVLGAIAVAGRARMARLPAPAPLPPNPVAPLGDLATALRVDLKIEGGAMGAMTGAIHNGQALDMQALVARGKVWALNGVAGRPDAPLLTAARGQTVILRMINDTGWPHGMHLHGHHFRAVGAGAPGPLRDTVLVARGETIEIAFVADNPGDWLIHCHMLEHAAGGMTAWLRVG